MAKLNPAQITQNVKLVFPDRLVDTMVGIALAESGGDAHAVSRSNKGEACGVRGSRDHGLFQIN